MYICSVLFVFLVVWKEKGFSRLFEHCSVLCGLLSSGKEEDFGRLFEHCSVLCGLSGTLERGGLQETL